MLTSVDNAMTNTYRECRGGCGVGGRRPRDLTPQNYSQGMGGGGLTLDARFSQMQQMSAGNRNMAVAQRCVCLLPRPVVDPALPRQRVQHQRVPRAFGCRRERTPGARFSRVCLTLCECQAVWRSCTCDGKGGDARRSGGDAGSSRRHARWRGDARWRRHARWRCHARWPGGNARYVTGARPRCCSPRGRSPRHRQRWAPFATRPTSGRRSANSCAQTRRPTILTQQPHPRSPATPTLPRRTSMPNFGSALRITGWPVRWAQRFLQANSTGSWRVLPYSPPASLRSGSCAGSRRTPLVSPPALWRLKPFGPLRRCKRHASSFCARRVRFFVRMRRRPQRHRSIASGCRVPRACPQRRGCGRVGRRPCCTCLSC